MHVALFVLYMGISVINLGFDKMYRYYLGTYNFTGCDFLSRLRFHYINLLGILLNLSASKYFVNIFFSTVY